MGWGGCSDKNLAKYSAIYHKRVSTAGMWTPSALGLCHLWLLWGGALSLGCPHLWAAIKADHQCGRPENGTRNDLGGRRGAWGLWQDYRLCCQLCGLVCPLQPLDLLLLPSSPDPAVGSPALLCSQLGPSPHVSVGWMLPIWAAGAWLAVLGIVRIPRAFSFSDQVRFCLSFDHGAFIFPE